MSALPEPLIGFGTTTQLHALKWNKKWPPGYDLNALTTGVGKELGLHSQTVQAIGQEYAVRRKQHHKAYLRYRGRRSLGWIPFKASGIKVESDSVVYSGSTYRIWKSRELKGEIKCGSFSQDARGRWYINLACETEKTQADVPQKQIGIDLGLKTLAALSDGTQIANHRYYRQAEEKLGKAQRARKKRQAKNLSAKIANRRKDHLHKSTTDIVKRYGMIVVGNVNAKTLIQIRMAKSVTDASWSTFRNLLKYKSDRAGVVYIEVNESNTSRTCSSCGVIPDRAPKGVEGLGLREWVCSNCGTRLNRDHNSAMNILRLGHQALALK